jgi:transposase
MTVGAVFGLTPSKYQSGEIDRSGRISRCGEETMRMMLYEAAQVMLLRSAKRSWLLHSPKKVPLWLPRPTTPGPEATIPFKLRAF